MPRQILYHLKKIHFTSYYSALALKILPTAFYIAMPGIVYIGWLNGLEFPTTAIIILFTIMLLIKRITAYMLKSNSLSRGKILIWSTLGIMSLITLFNLAFPEPYWNDDYVIRIIAMSIIYPAFILLIADESIKIYKNFIFVYFYLWVFLSACVVIGTFYTFTNYGYFYLYFRNWQQDLTFNYQALGDMLAVVSLLVLPRVKNSLKIAFFIMSFMLVSLCYSRSAIFCFTVAALTILAIEKNNRALFIIIGSAILLSLLMALYYNMESNIFHLDSLSPLTSRVSQILEGADSSRLGRQEITSDAIESLSHYWLFGRLFYELEGMSEGGYIHNALSYLLTYGAPTFFLLLYLIFFCANATFKCIKRDNFYLGIGAFLIFAILSVMLFRSHVWHILWFALAMAISANSIKIRRSATRSKASEMDSSVT